MNNFQKACNKYLSQDEKDLLTYEQKVEMINFTARQQLSDNRYNGIKNSYKEVEQQGYLPDKIGQLVDDLPLSDLHKSLVRYKYQKYTHEEIAQLHAIPIASYYRELDKIKAIMLDNKDLLEVEHDIWHKKTSSYSE